VKLAPQSHELERLRVLVAARLGLDYTSDKLDYLASVAEKRREANGCASFEQYIDGLALPSSGAAELRTLAQELTVTETFFFRNADHFQVFKKVVLENARARGDRRLRILSAGCASGEEPYSLAITLREVIPDLARWDVRIFALDFNAAMLAKAARGVYSAWSLRATPADITRAYFSTKGSEYLLAPSIREMVTFEERNLSLEDASFWSALGCDAVFCRNVLMYVTPDVMQRAVARFGRALVPGGFLFLGHAETLRGVSHDYHLCHTHGTFYYQRRGEGEARAPSPPLPRARAEDSAELSTMVDSSSSWVEAIKNASERIATLASEHAARRAAPATARVAPRIAPFARDVASRSSELELVLELMRKERFAEAIRHLRALPPESSGDPDALLLLAVLLTNQGELADAEQTCRRLLASDELHAGAHYLMALCREHVSDSAGAIEHDQSAIYLDPGFAMPHLHLGLLAKRSGDPTQARRELEQALLLLAREDAARLVLFGGGFSREALTRLCRAELSSLGVEA
jgi:chemotaxis protein methyltransferase CheR